MPIKPCPFVPHLPFFVCVLFFFLPLFYYIAMTFSTLDVMVWHICVPLQLSQLSAS